MPIQKVKFVTGFGSFGGSSLAILEHCRMLSEHGFDVFFYAPGSWHLGRFKGCRKMEDLDIRPDDMVVFHHFDLDSRPKCRKSILYLHEKSLWPLKGRNLLPFDSIAYVSEDQAAFHGVEGVVVPNPVKRMVDPSRSHPPNSDVAGVVGTIQRRKMQHLSVLEAIKDGRSKVLLFGDFEDQYFRSEVEPLLSDKVVYMGLSDPDDRMRMYNQFDHLYMFSSEESASLVLGECRILGKKVFKSDEVKDYPILDDSEIVDMWKGLFYGSHPVIGGHRLMSSDEDLDRLVCVVTHNRKETVGRWLRAWNNAEKFGAKIAVFHACDGAEPDHDEMANILSYAPDFYIPFRNSRLRDMRALHLALNDLAGLPPWKSIFWFTDDMMPMKRDFLRPFVKKLNGNVGLVAQCYEPRHESYSESPGLGCLPHIRTVAYALSRPAAESIVFPNVGDEHEKPYLLEHGRVGLYENHILKQVTDAGYDFALCHSEEGNYVHWTQSLDWMWDCHLFSDGAEVSGRRLSTHEMWALYESQFSSPGSFDPLTIFTPEACERMTLKKGKISAIIPTFSSPMKCFMLSVFSLLIRSDPSLLDHVFISINGPDSREGGHELQDRKQSFLEDLRSADWRGMKGFNPGSMTITRTWSRIGHSQALDQCIPWVDTEFYLSMHDDVIVMDRSWSDLGDFNENERMILKTWGCLLSGRLRSTGARLDMPHINTIFTLCRKSTMTGLGVPWSGFSFDGRFSLSDYVDPSRFEHEHRKIDSVEFGSRLGDKYESVSLDIGSFIFSKIFSSGFDTGQFDFSVVRHFESASWKFRDSFSTPESLDLEHEIMSIPQYAEIYTRHSR